MNVHNVQIEYGDEESNCQFQLRCWFVSKHFHAQRGLRFDVLQTNESSRWQHRHQGHEDPSRGILPNLCAESVDNGTPAFDHECQIEMLGCLPLQPLLFEGLGRQVPQGPMFGSTMLELDHVPNGQRYRQGCPLVLATGCEGLGYDYSGLHLLKRKDKP